jgi:hypothetical protein
MTVVSRVVERSDFDERFTHGPSGVMMVARSAESASRASYWRSSSPGTLVKSRGPSSASSLLPVPLSAGALPALVCAGVGAGAGAAPPPPTGAAEKVDCCGGGGDGASAMGGKGAERAMLRAIIGAADLVLYIAPPFAIGIDGTLDAIVDIAITGASSSHIVLWDSDSCNGCS